MSAITGSHANVVSRRLTMLFKSLFRRIEKRQHRDALAFFSARCCARLSTTVRSQSCIATIAPALDSDNYSSAFFENTDQGLNSFAHVVQVTVVS
jgi:hypothetical protein